MKYNPRSEKDREVLANSIKDKLVQCGFVVQTSDYEELVYARNVAETGSKVLVFTSIGKTSGSVRIVGSDAIRVCGVDVEDRGVSKSKRVNRTGQIDDIVERMYQRMRSSYLETLKAFDIKCKKCGANTFLSKKGNRVCSKVCWNKTGDSNA